MKQKYGMGNWKTKKIKKLGKGSQESGKKKGLVPPFWARYCSRSSRAYKSEYYTRWIFICTGEKIKWNKSA